MIASRGRVLTIGNVGSAWFLTENVKSKCCRTNWVGVEWVCMVECHFSIEYNIIGFNESTLTLFPEWRLKHKSLGMCCAYFVLCTLVQSSFDSYLLRAALRAPFACLTEKWLTDCFSNLHSPTAGIYLSWPGKQDDFLAISKKSWIVWSDNH